MARRMHQPGLEVKRAVRQIVAVQKMISPRCVLRRQFLDQLLDLRLAFGKEDFQVA